MRNNERRMDADLLDCGQWGFEVRTRRVVLLFDLQALAVAHGESMRQGD
jgi:hypothetical protein